MKVTLREKKILNGKFSLYLDFYPPITVGNKQTRREFLKLYVYAKPKTEDEREFNKETRILAESIRSTRQLDLQANPHGFTSARQRKGDFLKFVREMLTDKQKQSRSTLEAWNSMIYYLSDFTGGKCTFAQVDREFVKKFRMHLLTCEPYKIKASRARKNSKSKSQKKTLSPNTAKSYLERFVSAVRKARENNLISFDPTLGLDRIKMVTPKRDFLSIDELKALAQTPFDIPDNLRRAALFSILTGLRHSDIKKLAWANVQNNLTTGDYLDFKIKKTGEQSVLPISVEARELLGDRGADSDIVIPDLKRDTMMNVRLGRWAKAAGITRRITFHALRRTFATAQITLGTDLYTVSKLLGHSDVKQTQIYAHLVDEKKREAANKISLK